ncbi:SDR family NAD(P)-dependent oxidoreductase [Flavobacterium ginsenosidimutans]|uniref:SDR family NAD(P)-dependent oxidoreductase n=1 Tax=Flavobacterium ginsenosidimutans TaxID=687844 RepID=UPI000DAB6020|nr:SDR family NAD(P)-dependent oxidoreductase [Flavobacterium ginsenosidimutans]KAF2334060.1 SDR family oxidoreductase [Flavobacterium ginsenosidimutans]
MKNIIVTGTSRGIGYELALKFAEAGHQVLAISRKIPQTLLQHQNVTCLSVDLADETALNQVESFLSSTWKKVDAVVHNAGTLLLKPFSETTQADFESIYKVNVFAVANLTRICIPYLEKGSHVVTISSIGGVRGSLKFAGLAAYSSSKGAVITLTELLAEEYKEKGISFNVLALGSVQTEMLNEAFPGYQAPISAEGMATYIYDFTLNGNKYFNGKVLEVSSTNP